MNYEAILLDMDGVIIDTHCAVTAFWLNLAEIHGVQLTRSDFNQHIYGCPTSHTLDMLFSHLSAEERRSVLDMEAEYETTLTYTEMKGAVAFLRALRRQGVPTALVTSGARWKVNEVIAQLGVDGLFAAQVTENDIRIGKPHPECYLLAAQLLHKAPERCIVFEDSISGIKAALASGALCVGVRPLDAASPLFEAGACCVVPDFTPVRLVTYEDGGEAALNLQIGAEHSFTLGRGQL